jgi:imidazolonepropionase-like amidohydrolase
MKDGDLNNVEQQNLNASKRELDVRCQSVEYMIGQGVKMVAGSDSPWGYYAPGEFVHEMEMLARTGLSESDALLAGTSWSAASIGADSDSGVIEVGRRADLLIAGGDAGADVRKLWDVKDVFQAGSRVQRGVL